MWLFVPPKDMTTFAASAFVPVSEVSTLAYTLQSPDTELCVMSSETVSPRPLSWHGWQTRAWLRLLYGTICDPLTANLGAGAFISSLPVIRANRSRCRGTERAAMTLATFGPKLPESSPRPDPNGASLKTSSVICPLVSTLSPQSFKAWATGLQRASYQRRKLAHRTSAKGCSFWPTPTVKGTGIRASITLMPDRGLQFRKDANQKANQFGIWSAAKAWTAMWDLLIAAGWTPQAPPYLLRCRVTLLNGEKHSDRTMVSNPAFSDWIMGWPPGWTEPLQPVMGCPNGCGARVDHAEDRAFGLIWQSSENDRKGVK